MPLKAALLGSPSFFFRQCYNHGVATFSSNSLAETRTFAKSLLSALSQKSSAGAVVLALYGDLGSGKTALTKELSGLLGVSETVNSPTFVLEKIYRAKHPRFKRLAHIDAYRLEGGEELRHLGWEELLSDKQALVVVEWAERVEKALPPEALKVRASFVEEGSRNFETDEKIYS